LGDTLYHTKTLFLSKGVTQKCFRIIKKNLKFSSNCAHVLVVETRVVVAPAEVVVRLKAIVNRILGMLVHRLIIQLFVHQMYVIILAQLMQRQIQKLM